MKNLMALIALIAAASCLYTEAVLAQGRNNYNSPVQRIVNPKIARVPLCAGSAHNDINVGLGTCRYFGFNGYVKGSMDYTDGGFRDWCYVMGEDGSIADRLYMPLITEVTCLR